MAGAAPAASFRGMRTLLAALLALAPLATAAAQDTARFTHADSLRGANGPGRSWWDVTFYDLHVAVSPSDSSIRGHNGIGYRVLRPGGAFLVYQFSAAARDFMARHFRRIDSGFEALNVLPCRLFWGWKD